MNIGYKLGTTTNVKLNLVEFLNISIVCYHNNIVTDSNIVYDKERKEDGVTSHHILANGVTCTRVVNRWLFFRNIFHLEL